MIQGVEVVSIVEQMIESNQLEVSNKQKCGLLASLARRALYTRIISVVLYLHVPKWRGVLTQ